MLAVIGAAAAWFAEYPGNVSVDWSGWRINTSIGAAVFALALLIVVSAMLYRAWAWVRGGPKRTAAARQNSRRQQGYRALTQGMVAVAAGDATEAMLLAQAAEALLEDPPLTLLLSAQSAQLQGDEGAAEKYFRAMLGNPELEFLGLRGLLSQSLRADDNAAALEFARRAYALKPQTEWAQTTLFELQMASGNWKRAEALLQDMGRQSTLAAGQAEKRRAILLYEQAQAAKTDGDARRASRLAMKAHTTAPNFVPAAVLAAELFAAAGKQRKAAGVVATAWKVAPHPDLVGAFRGMWPNETPDKRLERFAQLVGDDAANEDSSGFMESKFGLARFAVDARDWAAARGHLAAITSDHPSARVCRLWAELEDAEHGPGLAARDWLMKAAVGASDPGWVCGECGEGSTEWSASCSHCQTFDSLSWRATGGGFDNRATSGGLDNRARSGPVDNRAAGGPATLMTLAAPGPNSESASAEISEDSPVPSGPSGADPAPGSAAASAPSVAQSLDTPVPPDVPVSDSGSGGSGD
jgi:HemY protein